MRGLFSAKVFFVCSMLSILLFFYMSYKDLKKSKSNTFTYNKDIFNTSKTIYRLNDTFFTKNNINPDKMEMKYILQWTSPYNIPFVDMGKGQEGFISRNCPFTNCFVTADKNYLDDITKFDVIAFAGPEVIRLPKYRLPQVRSPKQKYVFGSIESSHYYSVCSNRFDGFFNWTWTFRLDSEVRWGYIVIRDWNNNIVGPNKIMHWKRFEDMDPVSEEFKMALNTKTRAAAWFVSNCYDKSGRMNFALDLKRELIKYKLDLDIYGGCGKFDCPRDKEDKCDKLLDTTYYFYLSFENSFSEDYVTEKLLHGLRNNIVPIVYGKANYTRFMPDGIYLNAIEMGVQKLAAKMNELINDKEKYANFFRWKKYYSYHNRHESVETNEYCGFCAILNDENKVKEITIKKNFRDWWDAPKFC